MHSTTHITSNNNIAAGSFGRGMSNNVGGGGKAPQFNKINQSNLQNQSNPRPIVGRPTNAPPPAPSRQQVAAPVAPKIPFPVTSKPENQPQPPAAAQNGAPPPQRPPMQQNQPVPPHSGRGSMPTAPIQDQRSRPTMPPPQHQQPQPQPQQRPHPVGLGGAPAPQLEVVDDFSESQLRALERIEAEHLRKAAQPQASPHPQPVAVTTANTVPIQQANHQQLIQQANAAVAGAKALPQAPKAAAAGNISPPRPLVGPQHKPVQVTPHQHGYGAEQQRFADPEKPKMIEEITNLRKMLDSARKDRANTENMLQNQLEAEKKKAQLLEQERQRLQSELAFARNDGEQQQASTTLTSHTTPSKSTPKSHQNGVVSVGGVDMVLRKNTQLQQGVSPASRHKPASSTGQKESQSSRQQLLIVQTPANHLAPQVPVPNIPADPDTSPDHSGRKSASKKRKRTTTDLVEQNNNQVDVTSDEMDWDSQTVDDLMQVDAESDDSLNGATGKYKRQLRQFRSAFHLLQRLFVPSAGSAAAPSAEALDEAAIVSKVRDVVMKNVSEVLDEKLSKMGDHIVESLSKRRKLVESEDVESATPASQQNAKLQSLQKHLQETIFQRDSAAKKLEQAEMEVERMRSDLERSADRIRSLQEEHTAAIARYDKKFTEIDSAFQKRLAEIDSRYQEAITISATKDERIEELQSIVAQLVAVVQGHHDDAPKDQADGAAPTPAIATHPRDDMIVDEIVENHQDLAPGGAMNGDNPHDEAPQADAVTTGAPATSCGIEIEIGTSD